MNDKEMYVEAFARGLSVLRAFENAKTGLTVTQAALRAGISPASARRLLLTLVKLGYVRQDNNSFTLTPLVLRLQYAYLSSLSIRDIAQPLLNEFAAKTGEVCSLAVLDIPDVTYVARAYVRSPMERSLKIGDRLPAHATSTGHVLLGGLPDAELQAYLEQAPFERFTEKTRCDQAELHESIEQARKQSWALASEHIELGVSALAVPVLMRGSNDVVAAVTVSVNKARYSEESMLEQFLASLQAIAREIESVLCLSA